MERSHTHTDRENDWWFWPRSLLETFSTSRFVQLFLACGFPWSYLTFPVSRQSREARLSRFSLRMMLRECLGKCFRIFASVTSCTCEGVGTSILRSHFSKWKVISDSSSLDIDFFLSSTISKSYFWQRGKALAFGSEEAPQALRTVISIDLDDDSQSDMIQATA